MIVLHGPSMRALTTMLLLLVSTGCSSSAGSAHRANGASAEAASGSESTRFPSAVGPVGVNDAALAVPNEAPPGMIARGRLNSTLDAGLGRFLGSVRVDPVLERGAFVGFRIVSFRDPEGIYEGVDLVPGDVVVRVNGSTIERPEQALAVWNGLRVLSELCVEYVRGGERREIRYPIVD